MNDRDARTGGERQVDAALVWFGNLAEFGGEEFDPVADLAGVLDDDRGLATRLWLRFTRLPARLQEWLQTSAGARALRAWLEAIILFSEAEAAVKLRRAAAQVFYVSYPPSETVVRWTRAQAGWQSEELAAGAGLGAAGGLKDYRVAECVCRRGACWGKACCRGRT